MDHGAFGQNLSIRDEHRRRRARLRVSPHGWDAQRLKGMALAVPEDQLGSYAIVGALTLYLDFINLFIFLLRFLGSRRD